MATKKKELLPVYLLVGEDKLKRETMFKGIQARIAEYGDLTLNMTTFQAAEIDPPDAVASACNTVPFLSEKRLVVVRDIGNAKKAVIDSLSDYLEQPMESTVLLLEGDKLDKRSRLYKTVSKSYDKGIIACDVEKYGKFDAFVQSLAKSKNVTITRDAAARLHELVGDSTVAVNSELNKIATYLQTQGRTDITFEDVDTLVERTAEFKPWDLTDPLMRRDAGACMKVLQQMPSDSCVGLLVMCTRRVRELLVTKALIRRPGPMPPLNQVFGGKSDYAYRNHVQLSRGFDEDELVTALDKAAECELMMKTGHDQHMCLQLWVLGVCTSVWAL